LGLCYDVMHATVQFSDQYTYISSSYESSRACCFRFGCRCKCDVEICSLTQSLRCCK